MRNPKNVFHLAIPTHDLDLAANFYGQKLGCHIARRYDDRITVNFFGDQLVCHLAPNAVEQNPKMYPRHHGITFFDKADFDAAYKTAKENSIEFFKDLFVRFSGKREEHHTFFLKDPSNNLLEFKYYLDSEMMY